MLDIALTFLTNQLSTYLRTSVGSDLGGAQLTRLVDDTGQSAVAMNRIGVTLINVEEDRILKSPRPETALADGRHLIVPPALRLGLHVLFVAHFQHYEQALKHLSLVLAFFQAHPVFHPSQYPDLDERIDKLTVELLTLSYEQLSQVWAFVGAKQLPSAMFRVRLISIQGSQPDIAVPITEIDAEVRRQ